MQCSAVQCKGVLWPWWWWLQGMSERGRGEPSVHVRWVAAGGHGINAGSEKRGTSLPPVTRATKKDRRRWWAGTCSSKLMQIITPSATCDFLFYFFRFVLPFSFARSLSSHESWIPGSRWRTHGQMHAWYPVTHSHMSRRPACWELIG